MAIISSLWIVEEDEKLFCYWPNYMKDNKAMTLAIINHDELELDQCLKCEIVIKYSNSNYDKVSKKFKGLEQHSNASDSEPENKRRCTPVNKFSDYILNCTSDSDNDVPPTPKLKKYNQSAEPLRASPLTALRAVPRAAISVIHKSQRRNSMQKMVSTECSSQSPNILTSISNNQHNKTETSNVRNLMNNEKTDCCCKDNLPLLLNKIEKISQDLKYVIHLVQKQNSDEKVDLSKEITFQPIDKEEDLKELDQKLHNQEFFVEMCAHLKKIGGNDVKEMTRRILSNVLSHQLTLKMNWSGRLEKIAFSAYKNINKLILASVRQIYKDGSQKDIESLIKSWLRNAYDREGGRAKRKITE